MAVEHGLAALARTMAATPRAPIPTFEWATVVAGTGEVHVVLDSDPTGTPRPVSDNAAGPVSVGQRVHVAHHGLTLTLLSAPTASADTGWEPLTLMSGFTGGTGDNAPQWRVRDGWAMLRGRVTRDAGNWPAAHAQFAATPVEAHPTRLLYTVAVARGGHVLTAAVDDRLLITSAAATAEVHLESIPPWRVD